MQLIFRAEFHRSLEIGPNFKSCVTEKLILQIIRSDVRCSLINSNVTANVAFQITFYFLNVAEIIYFYFLKYRREKQQWINSNSNHFVDIFTRAKNAVVFIFFPAFACCSFLFIMKYFSTIFQQITVVASSINDKIKADNMHYLLAATLSWFLFIL